MFSTENDGLVVVSEYLALDVLADSPRQDNLFEVATFEHQTLGGVFMGNPDHILFDDGACVEVTGHIMAGGPDNLHTPFPCLVVGLCPDECGQEGLVDVDDVVGVPANHLVADDLHVPGQDDECHTFLLKQAHLGFLYLLLVGMVLVDGPHIVGDAELFGHFPHVFVIADDARYVDIPFSRLVSCKQVEEAMAHLADEDGHSRTGVAEIKTERHVIPLGIECIDVFTNLVAWNEETLQFPFNAHEESSVLMVNILVQVHDVAFVVGDEFGHLRDNALLVRAVKKQYGGWFHFFLKKYYAKVVISRHFPPYKFEKKAKGINFNVFMLFLCTVHSIGSVNHQWLLGEFGYDGKE